MSGLQGAVETAPVSRLHERQSFDPADFPVPTGREEEWRFTPLRRLRGLQSEVGAGDGKVGVVADAGPGVTIEFREHGDPGRGIGYDVDFPVAQGLVSVKLPQAAERRKAPFLFPPGRHREVSGIVGLPFVQPGDGSGLDGGCEPGGTILRAHRGGHQPTAPSICSSISRLSSSAYSIGSSRAIGSTKPRTIVAIASSSVMPRLIR